MKKFFIVETDGDLAIYESAYDAFFDAIVLMEKWANSPENHFTKEDLADCIHEAVNNFDVNSGFYIDDIFNCYKYDCVLRREKIENE